MARPNSFKRTKPPGSPSVKKKFFVQQPYVRSVDVNLI